MLRYTFRRARVALQGSVKISTRKNSPECKHSGLQRDCKGKVPQCCYGLLGYLFLVLLTTTTAAAFSITKAKPRLAKAAAVIEAFSFYKQMQYITRI